MRAYTNVAAAQDNAVRILEPLCRICDWYGTLALCPRPSELARSDMCQLSVWLLFRNRSMELDLSFSREPQIHARSCWTFVFPREGAFVGHIPQSLS